MAKLTKKQKAQEGKIESTRLYPLVDALNLVKEHASAKFDESIDVAVQLGVDAKKSDQVVRGAVVLPAGTGKTKLASYLAKELNRAPRPRKPRRPAPMWSAWTIWRPR